MCQEILVYNTRAPVKNHPRRQEARITQAPVPSTPTSTKPHHRHGSGTNSHERATAQQECSLSNSCAISKTISISPSSLSAPSSKSSTAKTITSFPQNSSTQYRLAGNKQQFQNPNLILQSSFFTSKYHYSICSPADSMDRRANGKVQSDFGTGIGYSYAFH